MKHEINQGSETDLMILEIVTNTLFFLLHNFNQRWEGKKKKLSVFYNGQRSNRRDKITLCNLIPKQILYCSIQNFNNMQVISLNNWAPLSQFLNVYRNQFSLAIVCRSVLWFPSSVLRCIAIKYISIMLWASCVEYRKISTCKLYHQFRCEKYENK